MMAFIIAFYSGIKPCGQPFEKQFTLSNGEVKNRHSILVMVRLGGIIVVTSICGVLRISSSPGIRSDKRVTMETLELTAQQSLFVVSPLHPRPSALYYVKIAKSKLPPSNRVCV